MKKNIEQQLEGSTRKRVNLSDADKQRMFADVLDRAGKDTKHKPVEAPVEKHHVRWPWLVFAPTAVAVAGVFAFAVMQQPENFGMQIADVNVPQPIFTNEVNPEPIQEQEYALVGPRMYDDNSDLIHLEGYGGARLFDADEWVLDYSAVELAEEAPEPVSPMYTEAYTEEELRTFIDRVGVDDTEEEVIVQTQGAYTELVVNPVILEWSENTCWFFPDQGTTNFCLHVNDRGFIQYEQTLEYAEFNGVDQAMALVTSITGMEEEEFDIIERTFDQNTSAGSNSDYDAQYLITPRTSPTATLPYQPQGWNAAIKDEKLLSLFTAQLNIDESITGEPIELVSSFEATARLRSDLNKENHADFTYSWSGDDTLALIRDASPTELITIESVTLQYEAFINTDQSPDAIHLYPVYRILGASSKGDTFEFFVDASADTVAKGAGERIAGPMTIR